MFDHVSNLPLHRYAEESDEVHNEDGPEHGNIENLEECADQGDRRGLCDCVPNLNSGNRLMKGLNSSLLCVGNAGPSGSSAESKSNPGSILGVRKAMNKLR